MVINQYVRILSIMYLFIKVLWARDYYIVYLCIIYFTDDCYESNILYRRASINIQFLKFYKILPGSWIRNWTFCIRYNNIKVPNA